MFEFLPMVASVVAGLIRGNAEKGAGYANAATLDSNAVLADAAAADALVRGEQGAGLARMRGSQTIAAQRTDYAAAGVDVKSGSALDVGSSTAAISELDAQIIRSNAARTAFGYTSEAKGMRWQAGYMRRAGDQAFTSSVLGGIVGAVGFGRGLSIGGGGTTPAIPDYQLAGP